MGRESGVQRGTYLLRILECQCRTTQDHLDTLCQHQHQHQQFVTDQALPHTQVRQGALCASGSKNKLAEGAFGKVYSLQAFSQPMVVKRVVPDTIATASNTLKEGVLLSVLKAAKQDFVPALHDCIVERDTCLLVMDQASQSLDACLTATVRPRSPLASSPFWNRARPVSTPSCPCHLHPHCSWALS
jgi:hypothetical protein